ncbi:hypothetical protein D3C72_2209030 [compost metagenome]
MANRDTPSIQVGHNRIELQIPHAGNSLRCEGFIDLHDPELTGIERCTCQSLPGRRNGACSHNLGGHTGDCKRSDTSCSWEVVASGELFAGYKHGDCAIGQGG